MASHDGASSSSYSSVSSFTHDVFLNYNSLETGNSFTAFLHKNLVKEGVDVYMDRESLLVGEEIKSAIFKAIQGSKIFIPVFSKGYADSRWCLDELVEIVRCHRDNRQIILPIFFDVDPPDVRHQTGSFKTSFDNHKDRFDEQTRNSWKEALKEVAEISGYNLGQVTRNQSKLVDLVVERVLSESSRKRLDDVKNPVGLDAHVKEVEDRLCIGSYDVQFVGIWGTGGIGKTAIAKTLYNRIFERFRRSCFLANIKGEEASGPKGLIHLQEQLINSISKQKFDWNIESVHMGRQLIIEKLQRENVFLILDDVDSHFQLYALAVEYNSFGPASKIIITSRDKHILKLANVDKEKIYCPKYLDDEQSLQLFSLHAFSTDRPPKEYLRHSLDVIHLAGGLPLTLEVLGSTFSDKDNRGKKIWKSMLQEPEKNPHDDVYKKLKISYDNLEDHEKSIFLDVACFFVGWRKEILIPIWDTCGSYPILAIQKLTERSLLKFGASDYGGNNDMLWMHNQIQAMGRRIVYEESLTESSKRSRIWSQEEILEGNEEPEEAQMLEGIHTSSIIRRRNFAMMSRLRILYVAAVESNGQCPHLPHNLRWLTWKGLIVPANFCHRKLVGMDLSGSQIREAWTNKPPNGYQLFQNLKVLLLQDCDVSYESFDFSWFPYLEILDLRWCRNMVNLHRSIGDLNSLVELNLGWTKIEELPNCISSLSSLKVLDLKRCTSLKNLPNSIGELKALLKLDLEGTKIEEIPSSIYKLSCLEVLILNDCSSLKNFPDSIGDLKSSSVELVLSDTEIKEVPDGVSLSEKLKELSVRNCHNLVKLPISWGRMRCLRTIDLTGTRILLPRDDSIMLLPSLVELRIGNNLESSLPPWISCLPQLRLLELEGYTKLESIPDLPSTLTTLDVTDCISLQTLPDFSEKLEELTVRNCHNLVKLPRSWGRMRCLRTIDLTGTRILLPQDDSVICLPSLVELRIGNNLESSLPPWISGLPRLRHLHLKGYIKLESIPDLPSTLTTLDVTDCSSLQTLPDLSSLKHLSSLSLVGCEALKEIRGFEGTESLEELEVSGCNTLTFLCPVVPDSLEF